MLTLDLLVSGLTLGAIYALVALGFHLVFRMTGLIDFAQGDKVVIGGLIGLTLVRHGISNVVLVLILVAVCGIVLGFMYDLFVILPTRRNGGIAATAATIGITLVFANGHQLLWGPNAKPFPAVVGGSFNIGELRITYQDLIIWVIVALLGIALGLLITKTMLGRGMVAAATDPLAATAVGINVSLARSLAFVLAFVLAAIAGVLVAPITLAGGAGGTALTIKGFTGAVLGGLGSTGGVVAGSVLLGVAESELGGIVPNSDVDPLMYGALIVLLLIVPSGIFGLRRHRLG